MSAPETPPSGDDPGRGMSGVQRAGIVLGALGVLLIVFVILQSSGSDDDSPSSSAQTTATQSTGAGGSSTSTSTSSDDSASTSTGDSTSTPTTPAPEVQTVRVVDGKPDGGIQTISYKKGDQVSLKVQSDTADEIHVHGYDLKKDVEAGGSVQFDFEASIEGRFEVELENAGTQIANLEVDPA
jgi:cytoskeletal protein RodZ